VEDAALRHLNVLSEREKSGQKSGQKKEEDDENEDTMFLAVLWLLREEVSCVCVYAYMRTCICLLSTFLNLSVFTLQVDKAHTHTHTHTHTHIYIYIQTQIHTSMHICKYVPPKMASKIAKILLQMPFNIHTHVDMYV
jgi:hypothetical protein